VALVAIGLTAASEVWLTSARRQRIAQADWAAWQLISAIGSYYEGSPGGVRAYPADLRDLLEDGRFPTLRRHLRTLYPNPLVPDSQWELIRGTDHRIRGLRLAVPWDPAAPAREYVYTTPGGG
jgi:type II secretory pathway pseudopilin PulG